MEIFKDDLYTDIHSDLTIESIICTRDSEGKDDFYIIDPNTGNFMTPLIWIMGKFFNPFMADMNF